MSPNIKRIAITGNIACGKSYIGNLLQAKGYPLLDSDTLVHQVLSTSNSVSNAVVDICMPNNILSTSNTNYIDRRKLGKIFFNDRHIKEKVEKVLHPEIQKQVEEFFQDNTQYYKVAFYLIPLLFETHQENKFDEIWLIYCKEDIQYQRLQQRNPELSITELHKRISAQIPQQLKVNKVTHIIDNSYDHKNTQIQLNNILNNHIDLR